MKILTNELGKPSSDQQIADIATNILTEVMQFRRMIDTEKKCDSTTCSDCHKPHIDKVIAAIMQEKKIRFVLPAFPGKSPNPAKVLGHLPDMAEKQALTFLNNLCKRIQSIYTPGAEVIICSDGRVFSDVVGIAEKHITSYQIEIDRIIKESNLTSLSTFNLDDVYHDCNFEQARSELIGKYGQDLERLKEKVKRGGDVTGSSTPEEREANRLYCGLTRFLVEDSLFPGQTKSKSAIQKECKSRAYLAIIRSNAWTDLIAEKFPEAIRLSIHPQSCGSRKIGIQLLGIETWMTPWHGVAVNTGNNFILMKHREVKELNAQLIKDEKGRPSHYKLISQNQQLTYEL
ncbi:L-tyrosine/L-tryptophan isonitrile synthase family protein [Aquimarina sp. TRL1]|uniref:L-tyrosine/L-tryptophan isonitrile synthase family protein n=1 Tax=Aquimarina sp. (strain TRL1) TaxID=2736252 RepID=UPI001C377F03|nr:isocyanide synthase family protein [Aquimarina sp. TRL1]